MLRNGIENSALTYFLIPGLVSVILLCSFFHIPQGYLSPLIAYYATLVCAALIAAWLIPSTFDLARLYRTIDHEQMHRFVLLGFCTLVVLMGPADIYVNGLKIANPSTYAEFHGIGRYIRHISSQSWLLPAAALLMVRGTAARTALIVYALVFSVLIVDRNRLLMTLFSLVLCSYLYFKTYYPTARFNQARLGIGVGLLIGILLFLSIGHVRSGSAFLVPSSGHSLAVGAYPLRAIFLELPILLQQLVLYITTPIFNFATVGFLEFRNPEFLQSQLSPFNRDAFDAYPESMVLVARFNVGTEFFPFLLYGGFTLAAVAMLGMGLAVGLSGLLLHARPNIFTLLIFLKMTHAAVFSGFAPQFYILLNLMFVILMLLLWFGSSLLPTLGEQAEAATFAPYGQSDE